MDRRSFIRLGMAGAATGIIAPRALLATPMGDKIGSSGMAGGLFFTQDSPGRWAKKAGSHLPILEKTAGGVRIVTGHPMKANDHWIVKHMLLDKDFNFIGEKNFDPARDTAAISELALSGQTGVVYGISVCNLHDTWLSILEV